MFNEIFNDLLSIYAAVHAFYVIFGLETIASLWIGLFHETGSAGHFKDSFKEKGFYLASFRFRFRSSFLLGHCRYRLMTIDYLAPEC